MANGRWGGRASPHGKDGGPGSGPKGGGGGIGGGMQANLLKKISTMSPEKQKAAAKVVEEHKKAMAKPSTASNNYEKSPMKNKIMNAVGNIGSKLSRYT